MAVRYEIYNEAPAVEKDTIVRFRLRVLYDEVFLETVDRNGKKEVGILTIRNGRMWRDKISPNAGFILNSRRKLATPMERNER